jgi:hypothetical protein
MIPRPRAATVRFSLARAGMTPCLGFTSSIPRPPGPRCPWRRPGRWSYWIAFLLASAQLRLPLGMLQANERVLEPLGRGCAPLSAFAPPPQRVRPADRVRE